MINRLSVCGGYIIPEVGCCGGDNINETCCNEVDRNKVIYKINALMNDDNYCKNKGFCNNVLCRSDYKSMSIEELNQHAIFWGLNPKNYSSDELIDTIINCLYYEGDCHGQFEGTKLE